MQNENIERDANLFAMFLLMPSHFIEEDLKDGICLADDKKILDMAKKYGVPLSAMIMRIVFYLKNKL